MSRWLPVPAPMRPFPAVAGAVGATAATRAGAPSAFGTLGGGLGAAVPSPSTPSSPSYGGAYGGGFAPRTDYGRSGWMAGNASPYIGNPEEYGTRSSSAQRGGTRRGVGALTVSAEDRNKGNSAVTQFVADVNAGASAERQGFAASFATNTAMTACFAAGLTWDQAGNKCVQQPDPEHLSFIGAPGLSSAKSRFQMDRLLPFMHKWNDFQTSFAQSIAVATYQALVIEYNQLRTQWMALGGATSAPELDPAVSGIAEGVEEGLKDAGKGIAKFGTYALAIGAVGFGLYLLGPTLIQGIASRRAARSAA
jgi:hypothetical protein